MLRRGLELYAAANRQRFQRAAQMSAHAQQAGQRAMVNQVRILVIEAILATLEDLPAGSIEERAQELALSNRLDRQMLVRLVARHPELLPEATELEAEIRAEIAAAASVVEDDDEGEGEGVVEDDDEGDDEDVVDVAE